MALTGAEDARGPFRLRAATLDDVAALRGLIDLSINALLRPFLDEAQIQSSRAIMGLDTQLILDGDYLVVEAGPVLVGAGGWSRRATHYGGDHSAGRDASMLDPRTDAARIRAMYTHPAYARRGLGRLILAACEEAAAAHGFRRVELTATAAGRPLYAACGYLALEALEDDRGGAAVPLTRMWKPL